MGRVGANLSGISVSGSRTCGKPGCKSASRKVQRHHTGHEFMFVSSFIRTRFRELRYQKFVKDYYSFQPTAIVSLCQRHHLEVHLLYDEIIQADIAVRGKKLYNYSWRDAEALMNKLRACCRRWLQTKTPGSSGAAFRRTRGGFQKAVEDLKQQWEIE